jgi:hypothetical protein
MLKKRTWCCQQSAEDTSGAFGDDDDDEEERFVDLPVPAEFADDKDATIVNMESGETTHDNKESEGDKGVVSSWVHRVNLTGQCNYELSPLLSW